MAAAWVTSDGPRVHARVEVLKADLGPARERVTFAGGSLRRACGPGCWDVTLPGDTRRIAMIAHRGVHRYAVRLPLRWQHGRSSEARALVGRAAKAMSALAGLRLEQRLASGTPGSPGSFTDIHFQLRSPDRMAATVTGFRERQVTIGPTQWTYSPGIGWQAGTFSGNGTNTFRTASLFSNWRQDEQSAQLLSKGTGGSNGFVTVALMNPQVPAWLRLTVAPATGLVRHLSLVTEGKFTEDRFFDYGVTPHIVAPAP